VQHDTDDKGAKAKGSTEREGTPTLDGSMDGAMLSPGARAAAASAKAAACKVVVTPGGPLPLPDGCMVKKGGGPTFEGFSLAHHGQVCSVYRSSLEAIAAHPFVGAVRFA
jgi:hypothetical protein